MSSSQALLSSAAAKAIAHKSFAVGSPGRIGITARPSVLNTSPAIAVRRDCSISALSSTDSGAGSGSTSWCDTPANDEGRLDDWELGRSDTVTVFGSAMPARLAHAAGAHPKAALWGRARGARTRGKRAHDLRLH